MSPVAKRFLCIWFPDWPIQRLRVQRRRESSMDDPIVLWHNDPRTGRVVVACCEKAAAAGLRPTMAISEAVDLLRRQLSRKKRFKDHSHASESLENAGSVKATEPACLIEEHDVAVDYRSLRKLAEWIQDRVSPLVSVETLEKQRWSGMPRHQSESLLCEITGVVHLFGSEAELLHNVKDQLSRFG